MLENNDASISAELADEDLERYLLGRIQDQEELRQVETHLSGCLECAERIQTMSGSIFELIKALQQLELYALEDSAKLSAIHRINLAWSPAAQGLRDELRLI